MRWLLLVIAISSTAYADKRIVDMTPGFQRELAACERQQGGLQLMIDKAKRYVSMNPADKADVEADIERLATGLEVVAGYCKEVSAMVQLLKDNATTPYKKVEKELDTRDNAVRKARKEGKKELDEVAPITRKLIPIVNARIPRLEEKKQTAKFPSGRVVELPGVTGSWKLGGNANTDTAELTKSGASASATVTTWVFASATCEQQRKQLLEKAKDEPVIELDLSSGAKAIDVAWAVRYVRRDKTPHLLMLMCVEEKLGGFVAIADITPANQHALANDITRLMVSMLGARRAKSGS